VLGAFAPLRILFWSSETTLGFPTMTTRFLYANDSLHLSRVFALLDERSDDET